MEELNKKLSGLRAIMKDMKAEMYAIVNPDLVSLDEYTKNLYLKMLCTVVQYENEPSEMQVLFLKRIVKGIDVEEPLEEYMRKALEISDVDIKEFIEFMKDNIARYYFALEGILLVSMGNLKQQNFEYLAEILELCGIIKGDIEYLSLVCKSILEQRSDYYDSAKEIMSERVQNLNLNPYIVNYYVGAIVDNDEEIFYSAPNREMSVDSVWPSHYTSRKITFKNLTLNIEKDWDFTGCENIEFINCKIITSKSATLYFRAIGNVTFSGCEFADFDNQIAFFDAVNEVSINDCFISNCGWTCICDNRGSLFRMSNSNNNKSFIFENNTVQNCYIKAINRNHFGVTGILINANNLQTEYKFINNEFIGCQCINNVYYTEAIISGTDGKSNNITFSDNKATGEVTRLFEF